MGRKTVSYVVVGKSKYNVYISKNKGYERKLYGPRSRAACERYVEKLKKPGSPHSHLTKSIERYDQFLKRRRKG